MKLNKYVVRSIPYTTLHLLLYDMEEESTLITHYQRIGSYTEDEMLDFYLENEFDESRFQLNGSHITQDRRKQRMPVEQFAREAIW